MNGMTANPITATPSQSRGPANPPQSIRVRFFNLYRLASYALVLYTLGHTLGAVLVTPQFGPESDRVVSMMKSVHLNAQGADCTWYGFYLGFGWMVSVFFLLSAVIAWHLGGRTMSERAQLLWLSFSIFLSQVAGSVFTWVFFFPAPRVFSAVIVGLLGLGWLQDWNACRKSNWAAAVKDNQPI